MTDTSPLPALMPAALSVLALGLALSMKPWRGVGPDGPPWPWLAWWIALPALWGADRYVHMPVAQPLSGACLMLLMCGWPLAVIAFVPVALVTAWLGGLDAAQAIDRYLWLGVAPATLAMLLGAAVRRWLPHHLMVYIFARGFFATVIAATLASALWLLSSGTAPGLSFDDVLLGRWLASWGDAWLTGVLVAIFVAFRPQWLATYSDRIYLPVTRPPE